MHIKPAYVSRNRGVLKRHDDVHIIHGAEYYADGDDDDDESQKITTPLKGSSRKDSIQIRTTGIVHNLEAGQRLKEMFRRELIVSTPCLLLFHALLSFPTDSRVPVP